MFKIIEVSTPKTMKDLRSFLGVHVPEWNVIGLYRDVWIAAIASSRTRLAIIMGVMCSTSQCELRSTFPNLRVT